MKSFRDFLIKKERRIIEAVGYANWLKEKIYFPEECMRFVEEYLELAKCNSNNNQDLKLTQTTGSKE